MAEVKIMRTLRHKLLSLEHNLICMGIECSELRTLDTRIVSKITEQSKPEDFNLGD